MMLQVVFRNEETRRRKTSIDRPSDIGQALKLTPTFA